MASLEEDVYDVEAIVNDRVYRGKKQYFIKWLGFPSSQNTWEDEENIFCEDLKLEYEEKKKKPKKSKATEKKATKKVEESSEFNVVVTNEWAKVIDKVIGVSRNASGKFEVEYVRVDGKKGLCLADEMHIKAPIPLLKFYEEHLTFTE